MFNVLFYFYLVQKRSLYTETFFLALTGGKGVVGGVKPLQGGKGKEAGGALETIFLYLYRLYMFYSSPSPYFLPPPHPPPPHSLMPIPFYMGAETLEAILSQESLTTHVTSLNQQQSRNNTSSSPYYVSFVLGMIILREHYMITVKILPWGEFVYLMYLLFT